MRVAQYTFYSHIARGSICARLSHGSMLNMLVARRHIGQKPESCQVWVKPRSNLADSKAVSDHGAFHRPSLITVHGRVLGSGQMEFCGLDLNLFE